MVPRTSFFELDVLEFSADHAPDDDLYLLRDTETRMHRRNPVTAGLRRVFVCQRRSRHIAGRLRTRGKARLVALRTIQRIVRQRGVLAAVRAGRSSAVRIAWWRCLICGNGTLCYWTAALLVSLHSLHDHHSGAAGAGHSRVRSRNRLGLRSSGARCHFFPGVHGCTPVTCASSIPVSSSPSALPVPPLLRWLNSEIQQHMAAENFYRTEFADRRRTGVCFHRTCRLHRACKRSSRELWPNLNGCSPFRLTFTLSVYSAEPPAPSTWGMFWRSDESCTRTCWDCNVSTGDWLNKSEHSWITEASTPSRSGLVTAGARAVDLTAARTRLQAFSLSIIDGFLLIAWSCVCALILVALLRKSPLNYGRPQRGPAETGSREGVENHEAKSVFFC